MGILHIPPVQLFGSVHVCVLLCTCMHLELDQFVVHQQTGICVLCMYLCVLVPVCGASADWHWGRGRTGACLSQTVNDTRSHIKCRWNVLWGSVTWNTQTPVFIYETKDVFIYETKEHLCFYVHLFGTGWGCRYVNELLKSVCDWLMMSLLLKLVCDNGSCFSPLV